MTTPMTETRTAQRVTIETHPTPNSTVRSTYVGGELLAHQLFDEGVRVAQTRTEGGLSRALRKIFTAESITDYVIPSPVGKFYASVMVQMGHQRYTTDGIPDSPLYLTREEAQAKVDREMTATYRIGTVAKGYEMYFRVVEVEL